MSHFRYVFHCLLLLDTFFVFSWEKYSNNHFVVNYIFGALNLNFTKAFPNHRLVHFFCWFSFFSFFYFIYFFLFLTFNLLTTNWFHFIRFIFLTFNKTFQIRVCKWNLHSKQIKIEKFESMIFDMSIYDKHTHILAKHFVLLINRLK